MYVCTHGMTPGEVMTTDLARIAETTSLAKYRDFIGIARYQTCVRAVRKGKLKRIVNRVRTAAQPRIPYRRTATTE